MSVKPGKANAIYQLVFEQGMAVDYPLTIRHQDGTLTEVLYNPSGCTAMLAARCWVCSQRPVT
ncbi:MAG: hypothetical protein ACYCTH_12540 [Cellulomonas sp.]